MILKDQMYFNLAKRVMEGAASEILVSQFKIDSCGVSGKSLVNELLVTLTSKAESGIKVKVLLDCILPLRGRAANNAFVAMWLKKRNVKVKYLEGNRCQHAKIVEVDGKHVVLGSHNWTVNSLTRNSEVSVYLTDDESARMVKEAYDSEFERAVDYGPAMIGRRGGEG